MKERNALRINLMSFALNKTGQLVYVYGDQHADVFSMDEIISQNYSLCQVGAGFVFVPVYVIEKQIEELNSGRMPLNRHEGCSYSVLVPRPADPTTLKSSHSKMLDFFRYEDDEYGRRQIILTTLNRNKELYSKEEAEQILGKATLVEVNFYSEPEKYYVSEASRLIAEAFKDQDWCTRILGLSAKRP